MNEKEISELRKKGQDLIDEIRLKRIELQTDLASRLDSWINNVSTISIAVGAAIVPLTYGNDKISTSDENLVAIGALILLFNGVLSVFVKKIRMENESRIIESLGYPQEAVLSERNLNLDRFSKKEITNYVLKEKIEAGNSELTQGLLSLKRKTEKIDILTDICFGLLLLGLAISFRPIIPDVYNCIYWVAWIAIGASGFAQALWSYFAAKDSQDKRKSYQARIEKTQKIPKI